jgi:hypothetical protein
LHLGRALGFVALITASAILWESAFFWPFKLLAVAGHETGHAVSAMLVGGSVERITLFANEGGQCLSHVPDGFFARLLVYSGGYVGSSVISVVLLLLTFRFSAGRAMLASACLWLGGVTIFFARDFFTALFCVGMAVALGLALKFLPLQAVSGINAFIAAFTSLYAVMDLKDDLWNSSVRAQSDAQLLAAATGVPSVFWAVLWTGVALLVIGAGVWLSLLARPTSTTNSAASSAAQ